MTAPDRYVPLPFLHIPKALGGPRCPATLPDGSPCPCRMMDLTFDLDVDAESLWACPNNEHNTFYVERGGYLVKACTVHWVAHTDCGCKEN